MITPRKMLPMQQMSIVCQCAACVIKANRHTHTHTYLFPSFYLPLSCSFVRCQGFHVSLPRSLSASRFLSFPRLYRQGISLFRFSAGGRWTHLARTCHIRDSIQARSCSMPSGSCVVWLRSAVKLLLTGAPWVRSWSCEKRHSRICNVDVA